MQRGRGATNMWFDFTEQAQPVAAVVAPPAAPTLAEKVERVISLGGNGDFYKHWLPGIAYTDGMHEIAELAGAHWLIDAVASYLTKLKHEEFQVWKLTVAGHRAVLTADDGNGNVIARQEIEFTDFPLPEIKLYFEHGSLDMVNWCWIMMLPSER